jgi:hypothetical protein
MVACGLQHPDLGVRQHLPCERKMRQHFRIMHLQDTIVNDDEGARPRCGNCDLSQSNVAQRHKETADCKRWTAISQKREAEVANKKSVAVTVFTVQGAIIETVLEFKYLVRILSNNDSEQRRTNSESESEESTHYLGPDRSHSLTRRCLP